jgi:hypothetical protein
MAASRRREMSRHGQAMTFSVQMQNTKEPTSAMGASVEEYASCKMRLAALQAEAIGTGDRLARIGSLLSAAHQCSVDGIGDVVAAIEQETQNFPTVDYIRDLAVRIKMEIERKQQLHAALKNMGVEPKD